MAQSSTSYLDGELRLGSRASRSVCPLLGKTGRSEPMAYGKLTLFWGY